MHSNLESLLSSVDKANSNEQDIFSFRDYLSMVKVEPWVTRNTMQLMYDMILSSGVDHDIVPGRPVYHKYNFFEDSSRVGKYIVFGQQTAKENLIERIHNASKGQQASKRLWILLGPPGSAKSLSMDGIKSALNNYSRSEAGKTYTILIPTMDERLSDRALFKEGDIYYIQAPIFEKPLQIVPDEIRSEFTKELNNSLDEDAVKSFLNSHPHYDQEFSVSIEGRVSPAARYLIDQFMEQKGIGFLELIDYLKVKRMIFDAKSKNGIGTYTPRDEKSQEAGSLVGNIDYSLLPKFGNEAHPLVHDYKGELCVSANGFLEIPEILKLSERFLYELLFATQDRFFRPENQPSIPFNGIIIGHTNYHEYEQFMSNDSFEALRKRSMFIEMPFSTNFLEEEKIYKYTYSNNANNWSKNKKYVPHESPHSLELLSLIGVMSRLHKSVKNENLTLIQKALVYAGRSDSGVDNQIGKMITEEFKYHTPAEGTFGLDVRFLQNVYEKASHNQINEFLANVKRLEEDSYGQSFSTSISLENPCVTPMDLYMTIETMIKKVFASKKNELNKYQEQILPSAKKYIYNQISSDVFSAILRDSSIINATWKKYCQHAEAYAHKSRVKDEFSQNDVDPDESFMSDVESFLAIPDKDIFRKELSDAFNKCGESQLLEDEPTYQQAIKRYVFQNEFKSRESMKLLGWIKSGASAANANSEEQKALNDTVQYLIEEMGYCGKCAYQALQIAANSTSVDDA